MGPEGSKEAALPLPYQSLSTMAHPEREKMVAKKDKVPAFMAFLIYVGKQTCGH